MAGNNTGPLRFRGNLSYLGWSCFVIEPEELQAGAHDDSISSILADPNVPTLRRSNFLNHEVSMPDSLREDVTAYVPNEKLISVATDLPRQLALIDVEEQMPKLSSLPHADDKVALNFPSDFFTSQSNVESTFSPFSEKEVYSNTVDGIFAFWSYGGFTTVLHDIEFESDPKQRPSTKVLGYGSHPCSQSIASLIESSNGNDNDNDASLRTREPSNLSLQLTNLNALQQTGKYFLLISKKTSQLRQLSQYISQSIASVRSAWSAGQEVPSRYITNVRETLSEASSIDIDAALYHQAVTGDSLRPVRDWLTESVHDRVRPRPETF